jgi:hypothetical protein
MMSAVASGNPAAAMQMGQQFYQGEQEQGLKEKQIEATRENRDANRQQRDDYRFHIARQQQHKRAGDANLRPADYLPEGETDITPENIQYVTTRINDLLADQGVEDAKNKSLERAFKLGGSIDPKFASDQRYTEDFQDILSERKRLQANKQAYLKIAQERAARLAEAAKTADPQYRSSMERARMNIQAYAKEYERIQRNIDKLEHFDAFGKMGVFEEKLKEIKRKIDQAYAEYAWLEDPDNPRQVGVGTSGTAAPADIRTDYKGNRPVLDVTDEAAADTTAGDPILGDITPDQWRMFKEGYAEEETPVEGED